MAFNGILKRLITIAGLFSMGFIFVSCAPTVAPTKGQHTLTYIGYYENSPTLETLLTETYDEGANVLTQKKGNSNFGKFLNETIELGHKKITMDDDYEIRVPMDFTQSFWKKNRVVYVLEVGGNVESTVSEYKYGDYEVGELTMTSPSGMAYKVTQWKDGDGNLYDSDTLICEEDDPSCDVFFLYSTQAVAIGAVATVYYDSNSSEVAGSAPADQAVVKGMTAQLKGNTEGMTLAGYTFTGWNTQPDGTGTFYAVGETLTVSQDIFLFAVWAKNYWVIYDKNNVAASGDAPTTHVGYAGEKYAVLGNTGNADLTGYAFSGWNTQSDGLGTTYTEGDILTLTGNTTLYALWSLN